MPRETLDALQPRAGGRYVDGTLGGAGHTRLLLDASAPDGRVLAIDADPQALERARALLPDAVASHRLTLVHGNFARMGELTAASDFAPVDGVLLDLGLSSDQLADRARGFSFSQDAPLDMRFDMTRGVPAADLVNTLPEQELADIIWRHGEERRSRAIARRIAEARQRGVATALLERTISDLAHGGSWTSCLFVKHGNPAERLYRQLGFVPLMDEQTWVWTPWQT